MTHFIMKSPLLFKSFPYSRLDQIQNYHCQYFDSKRRKIWSTDMDFKNNYVALTYYSSHVVRTGSWPNRNTRINQSIETISWEIANYPVVLVASKSDIDAVNNQPNANKTLVRLQ